MTSKGGKVYLVGAGPGEMTYLTLRGQQLLRQAEVVVYDALAAPELLQLTPPDCLHWDVGKRGGHPSPEQKEIDQLLVEQCQAGKQVIRLKSGDPFIFGRCGSEIAALTQAGCEFEVVPGLSSALVAPLLAGIPLTDPEESRCFAVLSGHEPAVLDWSALARLDTLVILMGSRTLPTILQHLQGHGRSPQTPIAIIRWGGRREQQVWRGTLASILNDTQGEALSPCVITIGEVARLQLQPLPSQEFLDAHQHGQFMDLDSPLTGKTILVTRSAGQSSEFSDRLRQTGASVIEMPALEIGPPSSWDALDDAISQLSSFNWLILTSSNAVDYFFERLQAQGRDGRALAGIKIAVVGQKTAVSLSHHGIRPDYIPPEFVADALLDHFPQPETLASSRILFPRVESGGRDVLVKGLTTKGAAVVEVAAYQSRCPATMAPAALTALQQQSIDVITFASSKTVQYFTDLIRQATQQGTESSSSDWQQWLKTACIASIGPQTSQACQKFLGRVDLEAAEYTLDGLTQAILDHFAEGVKR